MITPKELSEKASKPFFKIIASQLKGENIFPWIIPSNKRVIGNNYSDWKNDLVPLYQQSKATKGRGYTIDWREKTINGSKQSIPSKIYFETFEDYLSFVGRNSEYNKIREAQKAILSDFPALKEWTENNPSILLDNFEIWKDIIKVCQYFISNKPPHPFYLRELPIEVHSKFIEQNSALLRKLLDNILSPEHINNATNEFADRYGLKKAHVYTQIRILDEDLKPVLGYDECSLKLDDAAWLNWLPEKVFIIENQVCFLTFPKSKNSVAIFGEGFKSRISKHIPWLEKTKLYCWFDLDAAGFEMLHMIRQHYPNAISFLMNESTYTEFDKFSVEKKTRKKDLTCLLPEESKLYDFLVNNNKRLEQERITQQYVKSHLDQEHILY